MFPTKNTTTNVIRVRKLATETSKPRPLYNFSLPNCCNPSSSSANLRTVTHILSLLLSLSFSLYSPWEPVQILLHHCNRCCNTHRRFLANQRFGFSTQVKTYHLHLRGLIIKHKLLVSGRSSGIMETTGLYLGPKRIKCHEAENTKEGDDKISNLPDTLLHHILSFLPTEYAVRTCILSKRWKYIWTSVTSLYFDDGFYNAEPGQKQVRAKVASFMNFVDRVLIQNASSLEKFHLKCGSSCDLDHINAWICAAISRKVHQLCFSMSVKQSLKLPQCLFTSEYLVKLELVGNFVLNVPSSICLPCLIILYLERVSFVDDISVEQLFCSCPALEDLAIDDCRWDNISNFDFSIPTLKCLTIYHCNSTGHNISFNLPALAVLTYAAYAPEEFIVDDFSSLIEASIGVGLSVAQYKTKFSMHGDCVHALLEGIAHVKILDLDGDTMETLSLAAEHPNVPTFPNLKRLGLGVCENYGWGMLPDLLESSPGLEVLQFYEGLVHCEGQRKFNWDSPQSVPYCLLSHLKSIEISEFEGHDQEFEVIKFLVKNANVLERLVVSFREGRVDVEEQLKIAEKFLNLQKGSTHCRILIGTSFGSIYIKGLKG